MDNAMLAAYLMRQKAPVSPLAMFSQCMQGAMGPDMGPMSGAPSSSIWQDIGDFLSGRARKRTMDGTKGMDGDLKSWGSAVPEETSSIGGGGYM